MAFPFPQLARSRQKSWRRCPSCPSMTPSKQIQWSTMVSKLSTAFLLPFSSLSLFLLPFSFISSSSSPYFFLKALTSSSFLSSSCSPLFLLLSLCPSLFLLPFFHLSLSLFFFFSYFSNTVYVFFSVASRGLSLHACLSGLPSLLPVCEPTFVLFLPFFLSEHTFVLFLT